mmetsp:Transcript_58168/g.166855  ORF Transcript_58168/g.166855 Transcript_58168/m.166855 type:complete len:204 (-) Transcript_58168:8-619(-)
MSAKQKSELCLTQSKGNPETTPQRGFLSTNLLDGSTNRKVQTRSPPSVKSELPSFSPYIQTRHRGFSWHCAQHVPASEMFDKCAMSVPWKSMCSSDQPHLPMSEAELSFSARPTTASELVETLAGGLVICQCSATVQAASTPQATAAPARPGFCPARGRGGTAAASAARKPSSSRLDVSSEAISPAQHGGEGIARGALGLRKG